MNRETKVGAVVVTSFLVLVGGVVYHRMDKGDSNEQTIASAQTDPKKPNGEEPSGAPPTPVASLPALKPTTAPSGDGLAPAPNMVTPIGNAPPSLPGNVELTGSPSAPGSGVSIPAAPGLPVPLPTPIQQVDQRDLDRIQQNLEKNIEKGAGTIDDLAKQTIGTLPAIPNSPFGQQPMSNDPGAPLITLPAPTPLKPGEPLVQLPDVAKSQPDMLAALQQQKDSGPAIPVPTQATDPKNGPAPAVQPKKDAPVALPVNPGLSPKKDGQPLAPTIPDLPGLPAPALPTPTTTKDSQPATATPIPGLPTPAPTPKAEPKVDVKPSFPAPIVPSLPTPAPTPKAEPKVDVKPGVPGSLLPNPAAPNIGSPSVTPLPKAPEPKAEPKIVVPGPLNPIPALPGGQPSVAPGLPAAAPAVPNAILPNPNGAGAVPQVREPALTNQGPGSVPPVGSPQGASPLPIIPGGTLPEIRAQGSPSVSQPIAQPAGVNPPNTSSLPVISGGNLPLIKNQPGAITPAGAQVEDFQVSYDSVRAGDSMDAISMRLYRSDAYADALLAFNRDHTFAGAGLRQNPPQLVPGDRIIVPPTGVLEKRYPQLFRNSPFAGSKVQFPPPGTQTETNPGVRAGTPTPLPGFSNLPNANKQPVETRRVRVPDQGMHILEIARQVLGDSNRWTEIYRLNRDLQPQYPIPGGREILVPVTTAPKQ